MRAVFEDGNKPWGFIKAGNFLISCGAVKLSRKFLHRVSNDIITVGYSLSRRIEVLGGITLIVMVNCDKEYTFVQQNSEHTDLK